MNFIKTKTIRCNFIFRTYYIFIKTTGVATELNMLIDFFKSLKYLPNKVGFIMGENTKIMSDLIDYVREIKPEIEIYKIID